MVTITFYKDRAERYSMLRAHGHTGWSQAGSDIVCAAVSAILQAARLGLEEVAHVQLSVTQHDGTMLLGWDETSRDHAALNTILRAAELSLKQIAQQYPEHVRLRSEPQA
jgi:uncharacterized protein YsxB (DUF464 family)